LGIGPKRQFPNPKFPPQYPQKLHKIK
jgi:hypothetical protein